MQMINLLNKDKALDLKKQGFIYKQIKIDDKEIYQFVGSPELLKVINSNFSNQDFFMSKTMNF